MNIYSNNQIYNNRGTTPVMSFMMLMLMIVSCIRLVWIGWDLGDIRKPKGSETTACVTVFLRQVNQGCRLFSDFEGVPYHRFAIDPLGIHREVWVRYSTCKWVSLFRKFDYGPSNSHHFTMDPNSLLRLNLFDIESRQPCIHCIKTHFVKSNIC